MLAMKKIFDLIKFTKIAGRPNGETMRLDSLEMTAAQVLTVLNSIRMIFFEKKKNIFFFFFLLREHNLSADVIPQP